MYSIKCMHLKIKLDNWFNELKVHWTALNLNEISQSNSANIDVINTFVDHLEKHLEILNEQKSVTSDAIDKTMIEGQNLLDYLKEINANKNEQSNNNNNNGNSNGDATSKQQYSNSYLHLEGIIASVKNRYTETDSLLATIKTRLETNLQVKLFEKDAIEASQNLEHWAEELKYLNENEHEDKTVESAESWLHSQIQTANQMQVLVFELLQRGSDLVQHLEKAENANALNSLADILPNSKSAEAKDKNGDLSATNGTPTLGNAKNQAN